MAAHALPYALPCPNSLGESKAVDVSWAYSGPFGVHPFVIALCFDSYNSTGACLTCQPFGDFISFSPEANLIDIPLFDTPCCSQLSSQNGWPRFESIDGGKRSRDSQDQSERTNPPSRYSNAGKKHWGYLAPYPGSTVDVCDDARGVCRLQLLPQPLRQQCSGTASRR